jgi:aminoglycoside 6-adenylyltransferase
MSAMKFQLLRKLLEWRVEINHDWSLKPGAAGRGLKKHLDPGIWAAFAATYVGADIEENWEALFKTTSLFRTVAIAVGDALGYAYLYDLDERVTRYLLDIRNSPESKASA